MNSAAPLPDYAPVPIKDQIREARAQLAIMNNVFAQKLAHSRMSPLTAATELQRMQSVVRTLERLQVLYGPDAIPVQLPALQPPATGAH